MLRFIDSFAHYSTNAAVCQKYTRAASTTVINATNGRRGSPCLDFNGFGRYVSKAFDAQGTWIVGMAIKPLSNSAGGYHDTVVLYDGGTAQVTITLEADGTMKAYRGTALSTLLGTSSPVWTLNTYRYLEVKIVVHNTAGSIVIKVDGNTILSLTGQNTRATTNNSANEVGIWSANNNSVTAYISDLYICDGQGTANNDCLGDCRVDAYLPSGAGSSSQFTPSAGSNYQCVDDSAPNDDTDYVQTSTAGNIDTYAMADMTHSPVSIFGVQNVLTTKKDDAGARTMASVVRSGGTNYASATLYPAASYVMQGEIRETDPATGAAWTKTNFNASEWGIKCVA